MDNESMRQILIVLKHVIKKSSSSIQNPLTDAMIAILKISIEVDVV
jgi:hypothetical protein